MNNFIGFNEISVTLPLHAASIKPRSASNVNKTTYIDAGAPFKKLIRKNTNKLKQTFNGTSQYEPQKKEGPVFTSPSFKSFALKGNQRLLSLVLLRSTV